jgi:hypothetical protein
MVVRLQIYRPYNADADADVDAAVAIRKEK